MPKPQLSKTFRRRRKQAEVISKQTEDAIELLFLRRFHRLWAVRRFAGSWLLFWLLLAGITLWQLEALSGYFQSIQPVPGGIYNEGILGTLTNVNPIYATGRVDAALSHLIFAPLFNYDQQDNLSGVLASGYSIDKTGTVYTVNLKPNLHWQDGQPLTADDVAFTIQTIQNPDAQSPLESSWQGIQVQALGLHTVRFTLPNPLASFPSNLTVGILPAHLLAKMAPSDLRSAAFNTTNPVGAGPFSWQTVQVSGNTPQNAAEQIALKPFGGYILGRPKLSAFIVHAYASKTALLSAFNSGQLTAITGLDSVPQQFANNNSIQVHSPLLLAGNYVFFKTSSGLFADASVRKALVLAANPQAIIDRLDYTTIRVNEPLLIGQLGYDRSYAQQTNNPSQAVQLLNQDGWQLNGAYRSKAGQQLQFTLVAINTAENRLTTSMLSAQWRKVGVKTNVLLEDQSTYDTTVSDHNYDANLDGITIGNDPDVFVYWDGSQFDPRSTNLNFSEYNNPTVNQALEAGRTRLTPALRVIKYKPFLAAWQSDDPALGLYQPRALYITRGTVYGFPNGPFTSPQDRYDNVQNWQIETAGVTD